MGFDLEFWETVSPAELATLMTSQVNQARVIDVMNRLTLDPIYTPAIIEAVESCKLDVRSAIALLANEIRPKRYLEVGVRRGFSMAMLAASCPDAEIYGFDMWVKNYAGIKNPGARFVEDEIRRCGFRGSAVFVNGDSHRTLPVFFRDPKGDWRTRLRLRNVQRPAGELDLILVDGDHSLLGAYADLCDLMPQCSIGGVVVFDDIAPDLASLNETDLAAVRREAGPDPYGWESLLGVWHAAQDKFPNFRYFQYTQHSPGLALAVRLR